MMITIMITSRTYFKKWYLPTQNDTYCSVKMTICEWTKKIIRHLDMYCSLLYKCRQIFTNLLHLIESRWNQLFPIPLLLLTPPHSRVSSVPYLPLTSPMSSYSLLLPPSLPLFPPFLFSSLLFSPLALSPFPFIHPPNLNVCLRLSLPPPVSHLASLSFLEFVDWISYRKMNWKHTPASQCTGTVL